MIRKNREFDPETTSDFDGHVTSISDRSSNDACANLVMSNVDNDLPVMSIVTTSLGCVLPINDHREKICRRYNSTFRINGYEVHPYVRTMEQVVRQEVIEVVVEKGSETRPEQRKYNGRVVF